MSDYYNHFSSSHARGALTSPSHQDISCDPFQHNLNQCLDESSSSEKGHLPTELDSPKDESDYFPLLLEVMGIPSSRSHLPLLSEQHLLCNLTLPTTTNLPPTTCWESVEENSDARSDPTETSLDARAPFLCPMAGCEDSFRYAQLHRVLQVTILPESSRPSLPTSNTHTKTHISRSEELIATRHFHAQKQHVIVDTLTGETSLAISKRCIQGFGRPPLCSL